MTTPAAAAARWASAAEERARRDEQRGADAERAAANVRRMHEDRAARGQRLVDWVIAEFDLDPDQLGPGSPVRHMLFGVSDEITHLTRDCRKGSRNAQ